MNKKVSAGGLTLSSMIYFVISWLDNALIIKDTTQVLFGVRSSDALFVLNLTMIFLFSFGFIWLLQLSGIFSLLTNYLARHFNNWANRDLYDMTAEQAIYYLLNHSKMKHSISNLDQAFEVIGKDMQTKKLNVAVYKNGILAKIDVKAKDIKMPTHVLTNDAVFYEVKDEKSNCSLLLQSHQVFEKYPPTYRLSSEDWKIFRPCLPRKLT